jgi:hypothetical protein
MPLISLVHYDRILNALKARGAPKPCAVCGNPNFTLAPGLVYLIMQYEVQPMLQGPRLPCAALSCDNCGNTVLINLRSLGLEDLLTDTAIALSRMPKEPPPPR